MNKLNLSFFLLLASVSSVHATDFYVATTGNGDSCKKNNPCKTIQQGVDIAKSGDVVHVAAGTYTENVSISTPATKGTKPGITISGAGSGETIVVSAGVHTKRPVTADIVFDVWSANTTIEKLTIKHPKGLVTARDMGVFVGPSAPDFTLRYTKIVRKRTGEYTDEGGPGSRGILVLRAKGSVITRNKFKGYYQDHIHMPTSNSTISHNDVKDATRLGIVIIQESATSDSTGNVITKNEVENSGSDGIQIQGDNNIVSDNEIEENGGTAIKLCGDKDQTACVKPFTAWSHATGNKVTDNEFENNAIDKVVDNGSDNTVENNKVDD